MKLGICLGSLGMLFRKALFEAQKLGVRGVELDATGDFSPRALSQTGRRELKHLLRSHDLDLSALRCPLRRGVEVAENQQQRLDHVKEVLDLSFDMGVRMAIIPTGAFPAKDDDPRAPLLKEALTALGRHGDRTGSLLALETGPDAGAAFKDYLGRFDTGSLAACFQPANLLIQGHDPYQSARDLGKLLVYARAGDARYTGAGKGLGAVPLGHGDIDWLRMLATFEELGYHDWLVIEPTAGPQAVAEAAAGVRFLRRLTGA